MPTTKVNIGDFISYSVHTGIETAPLAVTNTSAAVLNANQSAKTVQATITTASKTIVTLDQYIELSYKNDQGISFWVVNQ